jgi:hypothetical protein
MEINGQDLEYESNEALRDTIAQQTQRSNQDLANTYNSGISEGRGLLNSQDGFDSSVSYGNKAEADAIRSRYMPSYKRAETSLKIDNMKNAQSDQIRHLAIASQAAAQEVEINKQKTLLKWKIDQANKKARGAVLGNVLGIVGGVVGGIYGGPAGAMAGYGAGQGIGNAAGSS